MRPQKMADAMASGIDNDDCDIVFVIKAADHRVVTEPEGTMCRIIGVFAKREPIASNG